MNSLKEVSGMKLAVIIITGFSLVCSYIPKNRPDAGAEKEDKRLSPEQIIKKYGYPFEAHTTVTEDGYIITIHRVPFGRMCKNSHKGVVLLQHGMLSSSVDWIIAGTKKGLAYILADSCYDVWMPNARGNTFSKAHKTLKPSDNRFWEFSFHELGKYDTPTAVDYILKNTTKRNLIFVGHSQGTTQFLVFNSLHPEYTNKIKAAFLLAPIAFLVHIKSAEYSFITAIDDVVKLTNNLLGVKEMSSKSNFFSPLMGDVCAISQKLVPPLCERFVFGEEGASPKQTNRTLVPIVMGHYPAGSSVYQLYHVTQLIDSGRFNRYDYGPELNRKKYGKDTPDDYDLSKVMVPITLFVSGGDTLSTIKDSEMLKQQLRNWNETFIVAKEEFNHYDYHYGIDVVPLLYEHLLERIDRVK